MIDGDGTIDPWLAGDVDTLAGSTRARHAALRRVHLRERRDAAPSVHLPRWDHRLAALPDLTGTLGRSRRRPGAPRLLAPLSGVT